VGEGRTWSFTILGQRGRAIKLYRTLEGNGPLVFIPRCGEQEVKTLKIGKAKSQTCTFMFLLRRLIKGMFSLSIYLSLLLVAVMLTLL
jgi:hypothetical protein